MTLLNVCGLSHHYAHGGFSGKHQHQAVLNNVSLTLKSGETVALLGRSGCGKSTLARLLVGLESPAQGNISWRGEPLAKLNRAQRKAFRRDIQTDALLIVTRMWSEPSGTVTATSFLSCVLLEERLALPVPSSVWLPSASTEDTVTVIPLVLLHHSLNPVATT